ncbi:MAG TPA: amidohydrolase, partial [Cyclobacteriaceae bacterium]|nr:amidohydrolase [Cyclobacteriaceae bacterium]
MKTLLGILILFPVFSMGQNIDFEKVNRLAYGDSARLVEIFKDLHANPELSFMETRTAGIVSEELKSLGYHVINGIGKTGVVGILQNGEGPVVMYRADMDALPVREESGLPYASKAMARKEDGTEVAVMHACGHDAHITWMLGAAKILVAMKNSWKGTLVFVAQPAEEIGQGAEAMVKDKMYERGVPFPDYLIGMHSRPVEVGLVQNCVGPQMSGVDNFDVTFYGIGGHSSSPHLSKDPVIMAATAVINYQTIVDRLVSAQNPHVITVGSIVAGTANNIIPSSAIVKVNLRWFTESDRTLMIDGIKRVNEGIALANDLPRELYPTILYKATDGPVVNNELMVSKINAALKKSIPEKKIITESPPWMVSEDFPDLVLSVKKDPAYDYLFIGIAEPELCRKAAAEGKE